MLTTLLLMQSFVFPSGVLISPNGDILVADRGAHRVFRIDHSGNKHTIIGNGTPGFSGDGGLAMDAVVNHPEWLALGPGDDLILADRGNHRVRRIDRSSGVITTIAGNGELAHSGDEGPAIRAGITNPFGLLLDREARLLIFDTESHTIRRVDLTTGVIRTVIGSTRRGFAGDGGPAVEAELYRPHNGVLDSEGRLVFGDSFNQRIRRWDPRTGVITTIAGSGVEGSATDGMPANSAPFTYFGAMAYDRDGRLVFTSLDHRILAIDREGIIRVIAGTGTAGFSGDGGPARQAQLNIPYGLAIAPNGDLVFADAGNKRIRQIDARTGIISTLAQ
jgi:sugar lactone lactonase YvrE